MNDLVYDKKSKAVLSVEVISKNVILKGYNFKGTFRLPLSVFKSEECFLQPITEKKAEKLDYNEQWPNSLAKLMLIKPKVRIITLNFTKAAEKKKKKEKAKEEVKKVKAPKPKPEVTIKKGTMSINDLATQIGISPASARGKLRGKVEKPAVGWKWDKPEDIKKIIGILTEC